MRRAARCALALSVAMGCGDPVHDGWVGPLGPEAPGVPPGPLHRPGQPCLACHGGSGPASQQFSVGGTVYAIKGQSQPLDQATVQLVDSNASMQNVVTNAAGNFYLALDRWAPAAPIKAAVAYGVQTATMGTHIGRDGSCADCHFDPPSPASAGRVYLVVDPGDLPDGSAPPPATDGGEQ